MKVIDKPLAEFNNKFTKTFVLHPHTKVKTNSQ